MPILSNIVRKWQHSPFQRKQIFNSSLWANGQMGYLAAISRGFHTIWHQRTHVSDATFLGPNMGRIWLMGKGHLWSACWTLRWRVVKSTSIVPKMLLHTCSINIKAVRIFMTHTKAELFCSLKTYLDRHTPHWSPYPGLWRHIPCFQQIGDKFQLETGHVYVLWGWDADRKEWRGNAHMKSLWAHSDHMPYYTWETVSFVTQNDSKWAIKTW